jgi:predicted metallopeptidase
MARREFLEDDGLNVLANKVIEERLNYLSAINIKFLLVEPFISKKTIARCIRPNNELKHFGKFDYLVEFSNAVWKTLDDKTKYIVMLHELKHIFVVMGEDGPEEYKIVPHSINDFTEILNEYGVEWFQNIKVLNATVHQLEATDDHSIAL